MKSKSEASPSVSFSDTDKFLALKRDVELCKQSLNNREQYSRCWSVRVTGLTVPKFLIDQYGVVIACMKHTYNKLFHPVLQNAVRHGSIKEIPEWYQLLENGHFIRTRNRSRNLPPQIIIRFQSRMFRNLFLTFKRGNMPRPSGYDRKQGIEYYSVTPDLTSINWRILKDLRSNQHVERAWSTDTKLLFTLQKSPKVINLVSSINTSTDELVHRAMLASAADEGHDDDVVLNDDSNAEQGLPFTPAITRSQSNRFATYGARPKVKETVGPLSGGQGSGKTGGRGSGKTGGRGSGKTGGRGPGKNGGRGSGVADGRGSGESGRLNFGRGRGHHTRGRGWGQTPPTPHTGSTPDWATVVRRSRAPTRYHHRSVSPELYRLKPITSRFNSLEMMSDNETT